MTRDELLRWLLETRSEFNQLVSAIPRDKLDRPIRHGKKRSARDVIYHVVAYEELIVQRLRSAQDGETTAFDRDRDGWESFNDRVWIEATNTDVNTVLARSQRVFNDLIEQVRVLQEDELNDGRGIVKYLDPAWLNGRPLWEVIGIDSFEHYPMHFGDLKAAGEG
jgi:hypothetical protein